jgi:hypothetical protein
LNPGILGSALVRYDAYLFIEEIKNKHWLDMLQAIDAALGAAQRETHVAPAGDDVKFMDFLAATQRYLLSEGRERPEGIDNAMLLLLKPLCESLVAKGRFPRERLEVFADLDAWAMSSRLWVEHVQR